ncbi:MAG: hypothetical protein FJ290_19185 [Planctomycetes bacterium]|nr:hypothetical protein [Planctomycetota bacterium]
MKKAATDELRPEYRRSDLGEGVRGKHLESYRSGRHFVLLSDDVAEVFPDDASVNEALRSLIQVAHRATRVGTRPRRLAKACR